MASVLRWLRLLPLLALTPLFVLLPLISLLISDLAWLLIGRRRPPTSQPCRRGAATVVIPNWNGRDLLEKYLPSVAEALAAHPDNEILVVDNGSTDGSVEFLREHFPAVNVLALPRNLGFGGGSNAGISAARNDIVVLLNSDMRVDPGFLPPLLEPFSDSSVFAVSCQIFFSDPARTREETGLTQGWWADGGLRVRHRIDPAVDRPFPCFYGGGGSCAFDRRKFLELNGFDELYRPFYLEDTDLGYRAWKRGWKVLYQAASVVFHEHRGTIGRSFSRDYIDNVVRKNFQLFTWKNIHDPVRLVSAAAFALAGAWLSALFGDSLERPNAPALARAFLQLPGALRSRWRARSQAVLDDEEAFRLPLGGYYRDRFAAMEPSPRPLRVLFVSPYPICPPVHGGGVFMYYTCKELAARCELHLIVLLDQASQREAHSELARLCASADYLVRPQETIHTFGALLPHAILEHNDPDMLWLIHRQIYLCEIDAVQFEYLPMGQFRGGYRRIAEFLFEHDLYFQSIARQLQGMRGVFSRAAAAFEYLRALRYELNLLPRFDRVQLCSAANRDYLLSFKPDLAPRIDHDLRAGVTVAAYRFREQGRAPETMLFLGSFRHEPNKEALHWFLHHVFPPILARRPNARLVVIGSDPPPRFSLPDFGSALELRGYVDDILRPMSECAVFVCPILSGSGVRVKLLEAFAAGIPVVSTTLGAEGLATADGEICRLADTPKAFAAAVLSLFDHPEEAAAMARRARAVVERDWDIPVMTAKLVASYAQTVAAKRS